jgi:hypothetical protein
MVGALSGMITQAYLVGARETTKAPQARRGPSKRKTGPLPAPRFVVVDGGLLHVSINDVGPLVA